MIGFYIFMFLFATWAFLLYYQICKLIDNLQNKNRKD